METYTWKALYKDCVVYEDESILGIYKPVGISVISDRYGDDIISLAKTEDVHIIPVHRIDKETSGLVVFAKNQQTHSFITRQFTKRQVQKTYLAIVRTGDMPKEGMIDLPLSVGRKHKVRIAAKKEHIVFDTSVSTWYVKSKDIFQDKRNYPSQTKINRMFQDENHTLLSVHPLTGRTHQIRVHLAWIGFPILGDPLFEKHNTFPRTYLHAYSLTFLHPNLEKEITIKALPKKDFFNPFKKFPGDDPKIAEFL